MPPSIQQILSAVEARRGDVEHLFASLAAGSPGKPGILRDTYGAGENFAHSLIADHAKALSLTVTRDAALNTFVTWQGSNPQAGSIIMGSHLDSVPHGGNFDGAAGVVAGLTVIAALKDLGIKPACDVIAMGVRAEESVWFGVSYIGSRSALGSLPDGGLEARRIDTNRTLAEHIAECGGDPQAIARREKSLDASSIRAFLEVHIEQAPSLAEMQVPLAICSGIPGNFRYPEATIIGRQDHVGTPRRFRRDAAMAAADLAMAMDAKWREEEAAGVPLAMTFGRFHTDSAIHGMTSVPGAFAFSLDVRAYDPSVLARLEAFFLEQVARIERERGVHFELGKRASAAVGVMSQKIISEMQTTATAAGLDLTQIGSPASHDAAAFAEAGVASTMLFVRNENGSHNPDEAMEIDDFMKACALLALWVADHVDSPLEKTATRANTLAENSA
jgi:N-carbamoyl-L-amino-acid hydrolase